MIITKMHGLGNDFILAHDCPAKGEALGALAKTLCERRVAVGADGLILAEPSEKADIKMRIFNADGSEAEMCGNGIRVFARYVFDQGLVQTKEMAVETLAGIMRPRLMEDGQVNVNMGLPQWGFAQIPMQGQGDPLFQTISVLGKEIKISAIRMGVPHAMVLMKELKEEEILRLGPAIEKHLVFPAKINVNFVQILSPREIALRTWERGAGRTLACGTGSCGCVAMLQKMGLSESQVTVHLEKGDLFISLEKDAVWMKGPAAYVFRGRLLSEKGAEN